MSAGGLSETRSPGSSGTKFEGVDLTPSAYEIPKVLLTHRGRIVTKGRLLRAVDDLDDPATDPLVLDESGRSPRRGRTSIIESNSIQVSAGCSPG